MNKLHDTVLAIYSYVAEHRGKASAKENKDTSRWTLERSMPLVFFVPSNVNLVMAPRRRVLVVYIYGTTQRAVTQLLPCQKTLIGTKRRLRSASAVGFSSISRADFLT